MSLAGKRIFVTGGSRGIGLAIALRAARDGASIAIAAKTAEVNPKLPGTIYSAAAEIEAAGGVALPIQCDLRDETQIEAAIAQAAAEFGGIDILINNAGVSSGSLFQMTSMESMKAIFEVNFFAQLLMTQTISRLMVKQKKGSIINIASISAIQAEVGTIAYGSSKAALIYATKVMAKELGSANVRVNAIAPSVTKTDMFDEMDPLAREKMINSTALKRPADSSEVANAALFLASELSSYTTGHVLTVDGGISG